MTAVFYSEDARRLHIKQPRYEQGWCGAELQGPPIEYRRDFRTPICADCLDILDAERDELRAQLDAARAELAALKAAHGWRWQTVENWLAQDIEHIGYWLTAETSLSGGLGFSRYTAWRYWNGDGWHDLREDDTVHFVAPFPEWPAAPGDGGKE